jgi:acyl dehydratase
MLDRSAVGRRTEPHLNEVEKGAVRRFATALGLTDPVHHEERAAQTAGLRGLLAPHTFPVTLRSAIDLPSALALGGRNLLAADQSLEIFRPICAGDRISVVAVIAEVAERAGTAGPMDVVVVEDEGRDDQGNLVYRGRRTLIVRPPPREA